MKRPHFALPEIYDDSLSYYDVLRKLIKSMHVFNDNLNKIPEQIANEAKARLLGDQNLQQNINEEASAREQADMETREGVSDKISELKSDLANSKKAIEELNDKKITKFYANSLVETTLNDSDNGKIQDMILYGKSVQDGTPTPDAPVEIQSVVNPVVTLSDGENSKTATLPYTLNAIPVSIGGNVTIDGQQYIADYVDIDNKKLVRLFGEIDLGSISWEQGGNNNRTSWVPISWRTNIKPAKDVRTKANILCNRYVADISMNVERQINDKTITVNKSSWVYIYDSEYANATPAEFKQAMQGTKLLYELKTPTETDLTDDEVQAFKELETYYPTTNVMVTSNQLDGYTQFNYPISMANGWNLIKQQLGDTREYIYDMDLQSAEAYVNSEYAVTLTELGV